MRKIFAIMLAASFVATFTFSSCNKEKKTNEEKTVTYRITKFSMVDPGGTWADNYVYTYAQDGKIVNVDRGDKKWDFSYKGNTVNITGSATMTLTLNDKGLCTKMVDEKGDERTYTYNSEDRITSISKNGKVVSTITLQDGCIISWTRTRDDELQTKNHKYSSQKNVYDIHNIYSEATDPAQWLYETGLFGHGTAYLAGESQWAHATEKATYTYSFDDKKAKLTENKDYPGYPERFEYVFEVIK